MSRGRRAVGSTYPAMLEAKASFTARKAAMINRELLRRAASINTR